MKITIIKQNKRFQVKCCFSYKVFPIITKFKKAYFDMSTRIWYLPNENFNEFITDLEKDVNYEKFDIKIIDQPTIVYIQTKEDKIHIGFSTFIDNFAKFMVFPGRVYNANERQIILDKEHLEKVINLCKDSGFQVEIKE